MSDSSIQIEYNSNFEDLEGLLSKVKRAGDFFINGTMEIPMPKVEIAGVGVLSFPVPPTQIAALIEQATRAPYGRGEETITDESVRKVWQLPPEKIHIGGKSWAASFDTILRRVAAGLGCDGMTVTAEFYKLLVYDSGGFFLAHRDTEKAGGMFGTLVIVLPSDHCGGELVIRHAGRETVVDMSSGEISEVNYAAFYADCEHEVRPITKGNRVCLVYNLIHQRAAEGKSKSLEAPDYEKQIAMAAKLLEKKLATTDAPAKIAWLLEHQYSPEGLSFFGLKSSDAAKAQLLATAAQRANCAIHLGIVHIEESGAAQENYHYQPRGWRRYHDYEDDEPENTNNEDFEVIEVCDSRHYIAQWRDPHDVPVEFGEIPVAPGELLPVGALDDEKPDKQRYMEASGNEGASFERSYHRAALVIWRRDRYAEVLQQAGIQAVLPYLRERIEICRSKDAPPSARKETTALARRLVSSWISALNNRSFSFRQPPLPEKRGGMLRLLLQLGDAGLVKEFISGAVMTSYDGSDNDSLVACAELLGGNETGRLYGELVSQQLPRHPTHCVELLKALLSEHGTPAKSESRDGLRQIAEAIVRKLDQVSKETRRQFVGWREAEIMPDLDAGFVSKLLYVMRKLEAGDLSLTVAEKLSARPAVFDPVTILVPALDSVRKWDASLECLWRHSAEFLLQRSGRPPESPTDWHQDVKLSCSCTDCRELQKFAVDPAEQIHRFRVRKERRQHLHHIIESQGLEMTHVTDRKGSPQTLVCTKDRRGYEARCDQYRKDMAALISLEALAGKFSAGEKGSLRRIAAARDLAKNWTRN